MDKTMKRLGKVESTKQLSKDVFSMWIEDEITATIAKPGQFLSLFCNNGSRLLPRPISICEIDRENKKVRIVYRVVGSGTKEFMDLKADDSIMIMGPLGNGFTIEGNKSILIGGGIGIPPMLELAKSLTGEVQIVLGYRDSTFLDEEFLPYGKVFIATEDGSTGTKGNVINAIKANNLDGDIIYACGPTPMLKGVKAFAEENNIKAQLSLEEKMACGVGACLACVCKSKEIDSHTHVTNKRICKDGPVFDAQVIEL